MDIVAISGKHVVLRPMFESDLKRIFSWRCNTTDLYLWFQRPEILSFEEFINHFKKFMQNTVVSLDN